MKKIFKVFLIVAILLTSGCTSKDNTSEQFNQLLYDWFVEDIQQDYLSLHFALTDPSKYGIGDVEVSLGDVKQEDDGTISQRITTLKKIDRSKLSSQQQISYDTVLASLQLSQQCLDLAYDYDVYFSDSDGINTNLVFYFTEFDVRNHQDALDYITLLKDSKRCIEEGLALVAKQVEAEYILSDGGIDDLIEYCRKFIDKEENEALVHFKAELEEFNFTDEDELIQEANKAINDYLLAGFEEIIATYESYYDLNNAPIGLCYYPGGKQYYEVVMQLKASTTQSAKQMTNILQDALIETLNGMISTMNEADYEIEYGFTDPYLVFDYIDKYMSDDFPTIANLKYSIDYLDPSVANQSTLAYYIMSPLDDINNNVIKVNPNLADSDSSRLAEILSHEGYPGHLYQHNYFFSSDNPNKEYRYLLDFIAYSEGWAMSAMDYCIDYFVADEVTTSYLQYSNKYGYILESFLDILVNYYGYEQSDVSEFLATIYNDEYAQELAQSIFESLCINPLRLMPYGAGVAQMDDLKDEAKELLGSDYSDLKFNTYILDMGATTYDILEENLKGLKN